MTATKKAFLFAHRWLGFITGILVFIVSITGCIYCFQDEIQDLMYSYRKVQPEQKPFLKPSQLQELGLQQHPKGKISSVVYFGPERSAQVRMLLKKKSVSLFFNPYSGQFLHEEVPKESFFAFIKNVHLYLFLPKKIGSLVNGISVLIFVFILISGIVLWWPKRKTDRKRSFTIKWNGRWRRVNYDLHNVLGFYAAAIAVVLAITGLSFSFRWMNKGIYNGANLGRSYPQEQRKFSSDSTLKGTNPMEKTVIDEAYALVRKQSPQANYVFISPGAKASAPLSFIAYPTPLNFRFSDNYAFDKYNGKLLNFLPNTQKSLGLKLNNMNYDIHTGQVGGLTGKIIAFLVSLISASLPVTGLIIYLGKKKKKKKVKKPLPVKQKRREAVELELTA